MLSPALVIPPGLDVPYFQVKCLLVQFSALWSPTPTLLSVTSFLTEQGGRKERVELT